MSASTKKGWLEIHCALKKIFLTMQMSEMRYQPHSGSSSIYLSYDGEREYLDDVQKLVSDRKQIIDEWRDIAREHVWMGPMSPDWSERRSERRGGDDGIGYTLPIHISSSSSLSLGAFVLSISRSVSSGPLPSSCGAKLLILVSHRLQRLNLCKIAYSDLQNFNTASVLNVLKCTD